jgi:hypothetical protein
VEELQEVGFASQGSGCLGEVAVHLPHDGRMLLLQPLCLTDICQRKMRILLIDSAVIEQLKRWIDM